jgi:hypothetical protein
LSVLEQYQGDLLPVLLTSSRTKETPEVLVVDLSD